MSYAYLGRRPDRIALAREFGATDVVSERGDEAVEGVRELTGGLGADSVLECVGLEEAVLTALECDTDQVSYEMTLLVEAVGEALTPAARA